MSHHDRCGDIIRLIDEALASNERERITARPADRRPVRELEPGDR